MTNIDENLFLSKNERPTNIFAGLAAPGGTSFGPVLFPDPADPKFIDLLTVMDWARAHPVYVNFRVATAFAGAAANRWRLAIFVSTTAASGAAVAVDVAGGSLAAVQPVTQGPELAVAGLNTVGQFYQLVMPPLNDLARLFSEGYRAVCVGAMALAPVSDWTQGGIDACFTPDAIPTKPFHHAAGY
jgi:hypothetical protein